MTDPNRPDPEPIKSSEEQAKREVDAAEQELQGLVDAVRQCLKPIDGWLRTATKEHPYMVISSAVGVSFLAGFLMRRRAAVAVGATVGFVTGCFLSSRHIIWDGQPLAKQAPLVG